MEAISDLRRLRHEIRNLVNAMNLNAVCLKLCDPGEALECVESIISASSTVIDLFDQFDQLPENQST